MFLNIKLSKLLNKCFNSITALINCFLKNDKKSDSLLLKKIRLFCDCSEFECLRTVILENIGNEEVSVFLLNHCIDNQLYGLLDRLLSQQLIDVNSVLDDYNWRPIHRAVHLRDDRLMKIILEQGSKINVADINGNTPLHMILQTMKNQPNKYPGYKDKTLLILNMIIESDKANIKTILNSKNGWSKSALHYATINVNKTNMHLISSIMEIMLKYGADPDLEDWAHRTPLYYCGQNYEDNKPIIDLLLAANCDPLNIYQAKSNDLAKHISLKHICRRFIEKNGILNNIPDSLLPKELRLFLNKKLINF